MAGLPTACSNCRRVAHSYAAARHSGRLDTPRQEANSAARSSRSRAGRGATASTTRCSRLARGRSCEEPSTTRVNTQAEALAYLRQAGLFLCGPDESLGGESLLLYYSFPEPGEVLAPSGGLLGSLDRATARHQRAHRTRRTELGCRCARRRSVFPELVAQLSSARPADGTACDVTELLPRVVVGCRFEARNPAVVAFSRRRAGT